MIEHEGIIEKINGSNITVRILQKSACSACHARSACMAADSKEKLVDIQDFSGKYSENERVVIIGKESLGYKAVLWAFVIPMIIILVTLIISLSLLNYSETEAALSSIIALVPYFIVLYFLRNKMANSFRFSIKTTN